MEGYFTLKIFDDNLAKVKLEIKTQIIKELCKFSNSADYALKPSGKPRQKSKWLPVFEDMNKLSKLYPDYVFKIEFEINDMKEPLYHHYSKNGKSQYCEAVIMYQHYDPKLLK
jgi:hypothetical protein